MTGKNDICARCGQWVGPLGPKFCESTKDLALCEFCERLVKGYEMQQQEGLGVVWVKRCTHCHKIEGIFFLMGRTKPPGRPPNNPH